jgi:ABC transport system ATP-binding/permease protein
VTIFQAEQISKAYSEKVLFKQISFGITQGEKLALIAQNGTGKTSLLNIIAGIDQPDEGICSYRNDLKLAYLQQQPLFDPELKVSHALLYSDSEISCLVREYEELMDEESIHPGKNNKKLQFLIERMDALNGWDYELRIKQVLTKLKIGNLNTKVGQLSGGQQKRLALARILIDDADFILMDEPTNHLDLEMIEWLEAYLSRKKQTLLLVTHDRYFLDSVCTGIIELDKGVLYNYRGSYANFLDKKQERLESQSAQTDKATNLLRKESEWMSRSPKARTTKSKARIEAFYSLQEKASVQHDNQIDSIQVNMARMGKKILELTDISKKFDDTLVLKTFSYVFKRGERVGIVGPNGCGKSTFLNIITGSVTPDHGSIVKGETIEFGYYRQEGLQVDDDKRVIDVITDIAESISLGGGKTMTASQLLFYFNFSQPSQYNRVKKLSGGEKRRLYLLTILIKNPNFLILDEPTNDFDIHTLNVLEEFLAGFEGCLLVVSHDRYFLDKIVDHIFVFEDVGIIKDFTGNYTEYRIRQGANNPAPAKIQKLANKVVAEKQTDKNKLTYKERQEYVQLEASIDALEKEKTVIIETMNKGVLSPEELVIASQRFSELEKELNEKTDRWLTLAEKET